MSFPPAFLDELRARLPLSDLVGKRMRLTRAGREFKGCCPFHNEKSASFYVNDDKQFFHCFGCGAHGDVIGFTMRHDRLSFPEAIESLAGQAGLEVPRDTPVQREQFDQEKRLSQLLERTTTFFEEQLFLPAGREALAYLRKRGLNEDAIKRHRLGYSPNDGQMLLKKLVSEGYKIEEIASVGIARKSEERNEHFSFFRNRVMFPVGDRRGRIVAFGGRVLGEGEPKYLNSPDHPLFHKGKLLYGLSRARGVVTQNQPLIVVEGYMDVIALVEAGYAGAVAPLGTALTEDQLQNLWRLLPPPDARDPSRDYAPILCFDGDNAGKRAAERGVERALPLLTPTQTLRIAFLPQGQDPDDLIKTSGKAAFEAVLQAAKPMVDMLWDLALAGRALRTPEDRGNLTAAVKQKISRIGQDHLRQLYQDEMHKRLSELFKPAQTAQSNVNRGGFVSNNQNGYNGGFKSGSFSGKGKPGSWGRPQMPEPIIDRRQPSGGVRLRERTLLALIINHPDLFSDFGEDLAHLGCVHAPYEALRQRVVDILSFESQEPLDAQELYRHLSQDALLGNAAAYEGAEGPGGVRDCLAEILSEATYIHAGFARPQRPLAQARQGWKSIWNKHLQEQLHLDMQDAKRACAVEASDENLARLLALRAQLETLAKDTDEPGLTESA